MRASGLQRFQTQPGNNFNSGGWEGGQHGGSIGSAAKPNQFAGAKHGKKLFVGGVPPTVDAGSMKAYFLKFGDVTDCVVMKDSAGRSRGFGFVQFRRKEGAVWCMQAYGTHILDGRYVEVKPTDKDAQQQPDKKNNQSPPPRSRSRSTPSVMRRRNARKRSSSGSVKRVSRSRSASSKRRRSKSSSKSRNDTGGRRKTSSSSSSSSSSCKRRKGSRSASQKTRGGSTVGKSLTTAPDGFPSLVEPEDEEELEEVDILAERAEQRRTHASALANIDDLPVKRDPRDLPEPITSWQHAVDRKYLNKSLMERLLSHGLERPTLIQRHAVPIVAHGPGMHDLIASAQTGSGKTFAFVIPTVARLVLQGAIARPFFSGPMAQGSPLVLMLSPTRELAIQTSKEIEMLTRGTTLKSLVVYGGEAMKVQAAKISEAQIDVLCATPGRLIDLIDSGKMSLSFVQCVVLDEADQMLDLGLEIMCAELITGRDMPDSCSGRQTLLFSATMPQKIRELCPKILRETRIANLTIGNYSDDQGGSCASIRQIVRWIPEEERPEALVCDLQHYWIHPGLAKPSRGKVVIFTNRRLQAGQLCSTLQRQGIGCAHLHGKLEQQVREEVVERFRRGQCEILIATNVAARGLDFPDISLVVQFQMPATIDIYTHRIGRTGRVGQVGCALAYMGPKDGKLADKLYDFLELNKQEIPDFLSRGLVRERRGRDNACQQHPQAHAGAGRVDRDTSRRTRPRGFEGVLSKRPPMRRSPQMRSPAGRSPRRSPRRNPSPCGSKGPGGREHLPMFRGWGGGSG